jgi:hypothetical protein|tara:strand:- start:6016 stop:8883 length:2868 start_codon:yes stop_codon:yes gene_type:complete
MGIGAAFATGLIGGLTRNMEREYEKRQSDQQKIDDVQTLLTEYAMKPADEKSVAGVNAVRDMLQTARQEVADRPRVGLLGRRSPELELDIGKLSGIMDDLSDFEFYVGSGDNKIGFNIKRPQKYDASIGSAVFAEVGRHMSDDVTKLKYIADPNAYYEVSNMLEQSIAAQNRAAMSSPKDQIFLFDENTISWWRDWQEIGELVRSANPGQKTKSVNEVNGASLQEANPDMKVVGLWKAKKSDDEGGESLLIGPISFEGNPNQEALEKSYMNVGSLLAANDPFSTFDEFQKHIQIFDITDDDVMQMLENSINLGAAFPRIGMLAPGKGLTKQISDENGSRQEKYANTLDILSEYNTSGTFEGGVYMLYPHFIDRGSSTIYKGANGRTGNYRIVTKAGDSQDYVVKLHYGTEVSQGANFGLMKTEMDDNFAVMTSLNTLAVNVVKLEDSVAYSKFRDALRFVGDTVLSIGNDLGFLDNLGLSEGQRAAISLGSDPNTSITSGFLEELQQKITDAQALDAQSEGKDVTFAQIMSLRIGLAFKMARAADPSGRLSDQDVRQQLERLGSDTDSVRQVLQKIGVVAKEFENRFKKLQVLVTYGAGDGRAMTPESKAVIDAAVSYDYISRQGQLGDGSNIGTMGYMNDEIDQFFLTSNNEPVYRRYKDATSTDALKDDNGDDQLFTKEVLDDGRTQYTPVAVEDLVRRSEMVARPNPTVDTAGRPVPAVPEREDDPALMGMKGRGPTYRRDPTGSSIPTTSEQAQNDARFRLRQRPAPVTGTGLMGRDEGRPLPEEEFPGLTDEEADIIRGLRGGQDEEDVVLDPDNIPRRGDPRRRVKPRPQRPVDPERDILPGEPGSGTEEGVTRAARGPTSRPRARPLPDAEPPAPELPEGAVADDSELGFTPNPNIVLREGEFSPETHQRAGPGSNDIGFPIKNRGTQELEDGMFILQGGKFVPVETM